MDPQFHDTHHSPHNQHQELRSRNDLNVQPSASNQRFIDAEINEGDIQYAAQFFKRIVAQRANPHQQNQEQANPQQIEFVNESEQRQEGSSQPADTPHFRMRTQRQESREHAHEAMSQLQQDLSKPRQHSNLPAKNIIPVESNPFEVGNTQPNNQKRVATDQVPNQNLRSNQPIDNQQRIQMLPKYEIDHSKQYFQAHPVLSSRLKKYKYFAQDYSSGEITSKSFHQGHKLNNQLTLTGTQLFELGSAVFRNVFRRMEQYLLNICKKKVVQLPENNIKQLYELMVYPTLLGPAKTASLKKFMKLAMDIPAQVTQTEIIALYTFMMKRLNEKHQLLVSNFDYYDQSKPRFVWTREKEIQLCQLYLSKKSLILVAEAFNSEENRQNSPKLTVFDLKAKLQQIYRSTISKIEKEIKRYDKNDEVSLTLTERDLRIIGRSPKALPLKLLLLKLNIKKYIFLQEIKTIASTLESLFKYKNKERPAIKIQDSHRIIKKNQKPPSDSEDPSKDNDQISQVQSDSEQYFVPSNNKKKNSYFAYRTEPKQQQQTLLDLYDTKSNAQRGPRRTAPVVQNTKKKTNAQTDMATKSRAGSYTGKWK